MVGANLLAALFFLLSLATGFFVIAEPAPTDLAFITSLVLALIGTLHMPRASQVYFALTFVFLLANLVSAINWKDFQFGARYMVITFYLFAIPILMAHFTCLYGPKFLDWMYKAFFFAVLISACCGVLARIGVMPGPATLYFRADDGLRLSPFFKDPNVYGPYLASGLVLLGGTVVAGTTRLLPGFAGLALIWIPTFFAFSRAAWLSIAVSAAIFGLLMLLVSRHRGPARRLLLITLGSMLVILPATLVVLLHVDLLQFFENRLRWQSYDGYRFAAHATALTVALDNPIGIGPGHFVGPLHFPDSDFTIATHNVYLKVWAENGVAGLTSFLLILLVVIGGLLRTAFQRTPRYPIQLALVACLAGMMVNGYFIDTLHWRHFFVVLGFSLSEMYAYQRSFRLQARHALTLP